MEQTTNLPALQLTPIQQGWLKLADMRMQTFEFLQNNELAIQTKVQDALNATTLETCQAALKAAKDLAAEGKECRLKFTNMINEKIITKSMEFEKRNLTLIDSAISHELGLRKEEQKKYAATAELNGEIARFEAHCKNEFSRIAAKYRGDLYAIVSAGYEKAINEPMVGEMLANYIKALHKFLDEAPLEKSAKFVPHFMDVKKMTEVYSLIHKYDKTSDLQSAHKQLDEKFSMYAEDLKNAEAAKKALEDEKRAVNNAIVEEHETETSVNNLVAQSSTSLFPEGPKVKIKREVVIENTEQWAMLILGSFIANFHDLKTYLRVKSWEKLSLTQMAAAIAALHNETGKEFKNLKFKEIEK